MDTLHILFNDLFVSYRSFKTQQFVGVILPVTAAHNETASCCVGV